MERRQGAGRRRPAPCGRARVRADRCSRAARSLRPGRQLAEIRKAAGLTQAKLAEALGVTQARVSKIEHGDLSGIDVVRAHISALGGSLDIVATLGDRSWKVA